MNDKICPFMLIIKAINGPDKAGSVTPISCMKENCEFWTKRINHYNQKDEYGCALVLAVRIKPI